MEHFYPSGRRHFQDDSAHVHKAHLLTESFAKDENDEILCYGFCRRQILTQLNADVTF